MSSSSQPILYAKKLVSTYLKSRAEMLLDKKNRIQVNIDSEIRSDLSSKGFYVIDNYLSREDCTKICSEVDDIIDSYHDQIWIDDMKSDHRIFGAELVSDSIAKFHSDPKVQSIGEGHLKTKLVNHMTLAARLEAMEKNLGSGGGWHRDTSYEQQFKAILYLSDVESGNGPFQYVESSHSTRNVLQTVNYGENNKRYSPQEIEQLVQKKKWEVKTFTAEAGTLILADTRGLHRGKPIESGSRYALTNYYIGAHKKERFSEYFDSIIIKPHHS